MKANAVLVLILLIAAVARAQAIPTPDRDPDPLVSAGEMLPDTQPHHDGATTPLTLDQLESAALQNNAEIRATARQIAVAEARRGSAGALEDPSLMYRGWGTPLAKPWDLNQSQHMFMFSQNIPGGGKRQLRAQLAATDVGIARADLETKKRDVLAQVRKTFYELLRNQEELRFHDEQVALARQGLDSARIKYVVGKVPQQDMLKAQIAITRLVEHLVVLQGNGERTRARLNTLLGRDPGRALEVAGNYEPPGELPGLVDLEKMALANRPELVALAAAIRQDETRLQLAEKSFSPDYALSGGYMLMPDGSRYRSTYAAEVAVTLPWLNRGRHDAEIAEATADVATRKAAYESRRAAIFAEIQQSLVDVRVAQRLVQLYSDSLRPQARAVFKATVAAYQSDRTDFLNLLDSQNTTLDVELDYIKAVSELETQLAELERALGTRLPRTGSGISPGSTAVSPSISPTAQEVQQ